MYDNLHNYLFNREYAFPGLCAWQSDILEYMYVRSQPRVQEVVPEGATRLVITVALAAVAALIADLKLGGWAEVWKRREGWLKDCSEWFVSLARNRSFETTLRRAERSVSKSLSVIKTRY